MRAVVLVLVAGCATTTTCPVGTKLLTLRSPAGRADACTSTEKPLASLPTGRTSESSSGMLLAPTAMPGGLTGPFTSWHANGALASHGTYVDYGARSVPDGVWAFWYPNGQRKSVGTYRRGTAEGCFMLWDEQGESVTGYPNGDELRVENCAPPDDEEIRVVEGRSRGALDAVAGDGTVYVFAGPNSIGAREARQVDPDPRLAAAFSFTGRKRFGPILLGPTFGVRLADNRNYRAYVVGGNLGVTRRMTPRIGVEAALEVGLEYITVTAQERNQTGTIDQSFTSLLPAAIIAGTYAFSPTVQAVLAARIEGLPHEVETAPFYCPGYVEGVLLCHPPELETWRIADISWGAMLGVRFVLR